MPKEDVHALAPRSSDSSKSMRDDLGSEIAAVRAEMDGGQRDFFEARGDHRWTSRNTSAAGTLRGAPRVDG